MDEPRGDAAGTGGVESSTSRPARIGALLRRRWPVLVVLVAAFGVLQLVPYRVENPPERDEPAWVDEETRALAVRACYDCHSNETDVLWFEHAAPLSWYITNHVEEGRAALNFSEWHTAAGEEADEAGEVTQEGEMPPSAYPRFGLHSDAELTPEETRALVAGLEATIAADPPAETDDDD